MGFVSTKCAWDNLQDCFIKEHILSGHLWLVCSSSSSSSSSGISSGGGVVTSQPPGE